MKWRPARAGVTPPPTRRCRRPTTPATFDHAGNEILEASPTSHLDFTPDAAGKLSRMTEETQRTTSVLAYDGRGFLAKARNAVIDCSPLVTTPTYNSDGRRCMTGTRAG